MPKMTKKQRRNYIDDKAFLKALHDGQSLKYDAWIKAMRKACTDSGGELQPNFDTHVRRKAGQVLRRINEQIEIQNSEAKAKDKINKWTMPEAPPKKGTTYLSLAQNLGLGGLKA